MKKYLFAISVLALAVNANAMQRLVTHYEVVLCEKDAYTAVSLPMVKDAR